MSRKKSFVKHFTKLLCENGHISLEDSLELPDEFSHRAKASFDDFLLSEGLVNKDDLLETLSQYYQVPFFDARGYFFKRSLLHMFPKHFLLKNVFIPIERDENILVVVANDPSDPDMLSKIGQFVSYDIQFRVGQYQAILDSSYEYYDSSVTSMSEKDVEEADIDNFDVVDKV